MARRAPGLSVDEPIRKARSRRAPASPLAEVFLLQRFAGNRAVSRAVQAGTVGPRQAARSQVKNPFADPAATADPKSALNAYLGLSPEDRRACIKASDRNALARVLARLSADQQKTYRDALEQIGRFVQEEVTRATAGMGDEEMAGVQRTFLEERRSSFGRRYTAAQDARTKLVEDAIKSGTSPAAAPLAGEGALTDRGNKAIEKVVEYARTNHPELALETRNIRLALAEQGFGAVAFSEHDGAGGFRAAVGREWVEAALLDPAYALSTVVHEIGGHPDYQDNPEAGYHVDLYDAASTKPRRIWGSTAKARRAEVVRYGYPESEIYALLREAPYRPEPRPVDAADVSPGAIGFFVVPLRADVAAAIEDMKEAWSPKLMVALLRGCRARLAVDPRISAAALQIFDEAVLLNFDSDTLDTVRN